MAWSGFLRAAAIAAPFQEWTEAIAILLVLAINTGIGFATELRAVRSMESLRKLGSRSSRVLRGGELKILAAEQLVPGDVVHFESGDVVTADIRLVEANALSCDEVDAHRRIHRGRKSTAPVASDAVVADRSSMVHKGTAITRGTGLGVVVATGMATELGLTTQLVIEMKPDASPLERKLEHLTGQLVQATLLVTALIAAAGIATGKPLMLMIEAAIALAVAAIPEGLPIVATMALARGMWRMAERNAVVERLAAVETTRRHDGDLHRQDRHAHREPHDGGTSVAPLRQLPHRSRNRDHPRRSRPRCRGRSAA